MYYHLHFEYGDKVHQLWNRTRDELVQEYILPFLNGHIIPLTRAQGTVLVNTRAISLLIAYKTDLELHPSPGDITPSGLGKSEFKYFECTEEILSEVRSGAVKDIFLRSIIQSATAKPKNKVFVIMKFGDDSLNSAYDGVIRPTFEQFGIEVERSDDQQDAGPISFEILESIANSKIIFSDLTGSRPNCYYETGFAQALGKELILSIREGESIHFDLKNYRFMIWKTENDLRNRLISRLTVLCRS